MRLHTSRLAWPIGAVLIVVCTLTAFSPAFRCGFVWDDDVHITKNPILSQPDGLARIWLDTKANCQYYPLTFSFFYIEHRLWGLNPVGYHVLNVLLHAGNALLVWSVLRRLDVPGGWIAAMLFALHPVEVESVAWVTEQKNTLSCLLALGALVLPSIPAAERRRADRTAHPRALELVCRFDALVCSRLPGQERRGTDGGGHSASDLVEARSFAVSRPGGAGSLLCGGRTARAEYGPARV